jgi:DNA-directed RNA polymerase subunit RPC12/RpoP
MTYICDHCGAEFLSFDELQKHKELLPKIQAGIESWVCPKCDREFSSPGQLAEHEQRNH